MNKMSVLLYKLADTAIHHPEVLIQAAPVAIPALGVYGIYKLVTRRK